MDESVALLRKAVAIAPDNAQAHVELGIALADAEQRGDALAEFTTAERLEPDSGAAHLNRARILDDMGSAAEAATEFSTSLRLSPKNPDVYYYWALLERDQGKLPKEAELLTQLTKLKPRDDRAFYLLGHSLADQGRHKEAISALRTAVRINPQSSSALYLLSRELRTIDPAEAESMSRRFLALRRQSTEQEVAVALGNQAFAASTQQDWPKAIALLHQAIAECNGCSIEAGLRKDLGLMLCRNGKVDEGAVELHKSLKLNPSDPDVVKALSAIGR
jgi:tetratricopeptide (TPR) repeat protein